VTGKVSQSTPAQAFGAFNNLHIIARSTRQFAVIRQLHSPRIARQPLRVHEMVGDLKIDDIEGDKDLGLSVGDIRVAFGHPCQPANG
jgi:hypothetical protein